MLMVMKCAPYVPLMKYSIPNMLRAHPDLSSIYIYMSLQKMTYTKNRNNSFSLKTGCGCVAWTQRRGM